MKLTEAQVIEIRRRYWQGREKPAAIGKAMGGLHRKRVWRCANLWTYADVGWDDFYAVRRQVCEELRDIEVEDTSYGIPLTKNPRRFLPDPECATPGEIMRWTDDVRAALAGSLDGNFSHSTIRYDDDGKLKMHMSYPRWGLGITFLEAA